MIKKLTVLEANIDDMNPQWYAPLMENLFKAGALDVTLTPVIMKKNRPGIVVNVLTEPKKKSVLLKILFEESTTLGVRAYEVERHELRRESQTVKIPYGSVSVKIGRDESGKIVNVTPEYESCRKLAQKKKVPLKLVTASALAKGKYGKTQ